MGRGDLVLEDIGNEEESVPGVAEIQMLAAKINSVQTTNEFMDKLLLTFIISFLWTNVYCQKDNNMTGYSKSLLKKNLERYIVENNFKNSTIQESDTTLLSSIKDSTFYANEFYYHFDKSGKCDEERKISKSSNCLTGYLNGVLSDTEYKWNKINDRLYLSKFSKRRIVELVDDGTSSPYIRITKVDWSRTEYEKYLQSKL